MRISSGFLCLSLLLFPALSQAVTQATVEAVQSPAWLVRDGARLPLALGARLRNGDEVLTGVDSRAYIRLADSSLIKLGENATFTVGGMGQGEGVFRAALQVVEGAFRFTTDIIQRSRIRRDVTVRFATVTAGVRGTDLWGRNFGEREVVVLIEGQITVTRDGEAPVLMQQPLTYYEAPRVGDASVHPIPMDLLQAYAAETELQPGRGALLPGGRWHLVLATYDNQDSALLLYDSLRRDGYPVTILPQPHNGGQIYRVRLSGFASRKEAEALGARLREVHPGIAPFASTR
ncbi:MAG TPA: SPOR domain-containing protein [Burkholderiales bacterium]|nr:SPOR domain-containing protein [Burkholderiales bacterium]